jgi:hypothetical protein
LQRKLFQGSKAYRFKRKKKRVLSHHFRYRSFLKAKARTKAISFLHPLPPDRPLQGGWR